MLKRLSLLILGGFLLWAGGLSAQEDAEYSVSLLGRTIDLEPYFQGFPYSRSDWWHRCTTVHRPRAPKPPVEPSRIGRHTPTPEYSPWNT